MRHRPTNVRSTLIIAAVLLLALSASFVTKAEASPTVELSFSKKIRKEPFTGRVVVFMWPAEKGKPPRSWGMISEEPVASIEVTDWRPGVVIPFDGPDRSKQTKPISHPVEFDEIRGKYRIRAVMQTNTTQPNGLDTPGNLASKWTAVNFAPENNKRIVLKIDSKNEINKRPEAQGRVAVTMKSKLLSEFHGRDVEMRATVRLPDVYGEDEARRFPAIYFIPGFGGDDRQALQLAGMLGEAEEPFVRIGLDPNLRFGHTVFADSDNNGPCGRALIEEFIPYLEKRFRLISETRGRYLTGHSSGGWSSLWLQITYPDFFNGCWAGSPDPVDFHDFTGVNLYDDQNFYKNKEGEARPIMREGDEVKCLIEALARQENVIGPGGQLQAFEAVFSPKGKDGLPLSMYDRKSGEIDKKVVEAWKRYDIVQVLSRDWKTLGPKLDGKITVIMGEADTFYLNGATQLLKKKLNELGSDARVFIVPGLDHGTIIFSPPYRAVVPEMVKRFRESKPN